MFLAPVLYVIYVILSGLAFSIFIPFCMTSGTGFSQGLIDFILLCGNVHRTVLFPLVGAYYALVYYVSFRFLITIWNLKTGRELTSTIISVQNGKKISEDLVENFRGKKEHHQFKCSYYTFTC